MKNLERELNCLYDLAYNVVNPANKEDTDNAYKTIKKSLERLEKLERVVKIIKKMKVIYERKILEAGICDVISNEECHLMIEVFGK